MQVKDLIELLKQYPQDANVCVCGNGKGGSPYIDIGVDGEGGEIFEAEDYEPHESTEPSVTYKGEEGKDYRKVVVLFSDDDIY